MNDAVPNAPATRLASAVARVVATVVVAAVVATASIVGLATPAAATPAAPACTVLPLPQGVQRADAVFTGTVESATPSGSGFVHEVSVDRVYQGSIEALTVRVTTRGGDRCSLGQLTGRPYVFLVQGSGRSWVAGDAGGTAPATAARVRQVEGLLGRGEAPVLPQPEPEPVEITPVGAGEPADFSRLAAPGLAMVLAGLLGLAVTRRAGRR